jgi:DNA recombination protein RmuC
MEFIFSISGFALGAILVFIWRKIHMDRQSIQLNNLHIELASTKQNVDNKEQDLIRLRAEYKLLEQGRNQSNTEAIQWKSKTEAMQEKLQVQQDELAQIRDSFYRDFKLMANELLEDKSKRFTETNKENIDHILKPLKEKLVEFELKVDRTHKDSLVANASLVQQILGLQQLNEQMSKDAVNLTKALKGDSKTQGNWGEFILESVLEKSGLIRDREFFIQQSHQSEDGRRFQPDVIIRLPENKSLIIDSKVSLIAYEKFSNFETDEERNKFLKEHLFSIRQHVKSLSEKKYQHLLTVETLDFVLLFIPIEPAFAAAVQGDAALFNEAFEKNIIIVSPTTLLATLRTIASIWRQENQTKNAQEIADRAGKMYDKFVSMADDLLKLGNQLDTSQKTYDEVMRKLKTGSGNLVKRSEELRRLGAKTSKEFSGGLIEKTLDNDV